MASNRHLGRIIALQTLYEQEFRHEAGDADFDNLAVLERNVARYKEMVDDLDFIKRLVLGVTRPRVGLLSNGEEETKGNKLVQETHQLLKTADLEFIGNVEGKDVPRGLVDVVVCDGFVGNVLIKLAEGIGEFTFALMREEISRSLVGVVGALLLRPALRRIRRRVDYQEYGGAPLLGVRGVVIVAHGRSRARAIRNALRVADQAARVNLTEALAMRARPGDQPVAETSATEETQ